MRWSSGTAADDSEWLKTDTRWTFKVDRIDTQGGSIDGKPLHAS